MSALPDFSMFDVASAAAASLIALVFLFGYRIRYRDAEREARWVSAVGGSSAARVGISEMLLATGDRVSSIEGCLSGTLGYLMGQMESGEPLSSSVARAAEQGYTEPDPVTDLAGTDVARKAIILARLSGLVLSDQPVQLEGRPYPNPRVAFRDPLSPHETAG